MIILEVQSFEADNLDQLDNLINEHIKEGQLYEVKITYESHLNFDGHGSDSYVAHLEYKQYRRD